MRQDIQCIRAIAIISVIFFHVFPECFPNGYLGVDIFFVISGYLMATILTKNQLDFKSISTFYYRRTKRILPLYLLVLLLVIISKQYLQTDVWRGINNLYAMFASVFLVNQKIIHDQADYFNSFKSDQKSSSNLFLHCWSLSVEVQFYIIVPFIFLGVQFLKNRYLKLLLLSIILFSSYSITFISVDPNFTFNFTPARIWQFTVGMLVYILNIAQKTGKEIEEKIQSNFIKNQLELVGFSTILFVFLPFFIESDYMRPFITIITAFVIYNEFGNNENEILSSRILSYIGDLSYVLYLVHWPVFVYFRYSYDKIGVLCLILLISIIIHHSFETLILRQNIYIVSAVIATLASFTIISQVILHYNPHFISRTYSPENLQLVNTNKDFMRSLWKWPNCKIRGRSESDQEAKLGHCDYENGNGTRKVLIIGNSYAMNQADIIHQSFAGNYSSFEYLSIIGNYAIFENHKDNSAESLELSKKLAAEIKPDVLFIVTRFGTEQKEPITTDDIIIQQYTDSLSFYERVAKKIYIMGTFPIFPVNFLNFFIENIQMEFERWNAFRYSEKEIHKESRFARERLNQISCKKCEIYDLGSVFLDNGYYYGYDKKTNLAYFDNDIHLTQHGLEAILPFYNNLTSNINIVD